MKKFLIFCSLAIALFWGGRYIFYSTSFVFPGIVEKDTEVFVKSEGKDILIKEHGAWSVLNIRGVNIGSGKPGKYATEFAITYEEYMRWFQLIQEMNANVIRVYTIQSEEFYQAFYDFNQKSEKPLYLIHGVWVDDYAMRSHLDAYADEMREALKEDGKTVVDIIHGRRTIEYNTKYAYGTYRNDISEYVLGYIIGVEWESDLVLYTNERRKEIRGFDGQYLYTDHNASPFECLLAEVGDTMLAYETAKYQQQRLVAFSNWPETDPLRHEIWKIHQTSNLARVDVEHIRMKDTVKSGTFASYHVYPYYPLFYEFEEQYATYRDENNRKNPYRGYLKDLNDHHTIPVIISEFGIPASRGIARFDKARGFDQGNTTETEQGEELQALYEDIRKSGCGGGIVFSWQDEWFKKTWNTWAGVDLTRNVYWSDYQTNEQSFGLLAFDPGKERSQCYVDGNVEDWEEISPVVWDENMALSMQYDEKFIYFRIHNQRPEVEQAFYIGVDLTPKSGALYNQEEDLAFDTPVDFLIKINSREDSWMKVQEYYDMVYANYRTDIWNEDAFLHKPKKNSPVFHNIYQYLRGPIELDSSGIKTEPEIFDSGQLVYGNANPESPDYNSLADYFIGENDIEIRIPWGLFNFSDPSEMVIHDDYYEHYGVVNRSIDHMRLTLGAGNAVKKMLPSVEAELKGWGEHPQYHERLKKSYFYVKDIFGQYAKEDDHARSARE